MPVRVADGTRCPVHGGVVTIISDVRMPVAMEGTYRAVWWSLLHWSTLALDGSSLSLQLGTWVDLTAAN